MSSSEQINSTPQTTPTRPGGSTTALNDLRTLVSALALSMIVLCIAFGAFVGMQWRWMSQAIDARKAQMEQVQKNLKQWEPALSELAVYSKGKPEFEAIFRKYGIDISGAGAPVPAPKAP